MANEQAQGRPAAPAANAEGRHYNSDIFTRRYFDSLLVEMRLIDSGLASTKTDFFGMELETPIMYGVMAGYDKEWDLLKEEGEAAKEVGSVVWISSHMTSEYVKKVTDTGAKVVQVVKPFLDNDKLIDRLKEAEALGCVAVASDIDHAYSKNGGYDEQRDEVFGPKSTEDLKAVVAAVNVPFIAKGVLSVQDAVKCREAGVSGILLSHHHSIMDCAVPPLLLLPEIRKAVGDDYPIYVDCSIDSGADAFKALALGADGVCSARAMMKHVKGGKEEMAEALRQMTGELRSFMNRTSSPDVKHIDPSVIHHMPY